VARASDLEQSVGQQAARSGQWACTVDRHKADIRSTSRPGYSAEISTLYPFASS
jgi:hypothetical protein